MRFKSLRFITTVALLLALFVMMLGAYTRLTDAGLGCPDWPGCYGRMMLPTVQTELSHAQSQYPQVPLEERKAWTEMVHRYAAGTLALLILYMFLNAVVYRPAVQPTPRTMPVILLGLVFFQALLGMWTVTLKLLPIVVMGHLLGGMLIFTCLCYFRWQLSSVQIIVKKPTADKSSWIVWISLGFVIVFFQIALGGWVSSNYAGISCIGFPQCNGVWFPQLHFSSGFNLFSTIGANYQGGLLDNDARITIQFMHRIGAVVTALYILILSAFVFLRCKEQVMRRVMVLAVLMLALQITLGIMNVIYLLPLWVAVAHNGVAALLLASMISMVYLARRGAQCR